MLLFEDSERSLFATLYNNAYSVHDSYMFCGGVGNVVTEFNKRVNAGERVVCIVDVPPGNNDTRRTYSRLRRSCLKADSFAMVLPVICSEYVFLHSLKDRLPFMVNKELSDCILRDCGWFSTKYSDKKTYEGFCKAVLRDDGTSKCISHSTVDNEFYSRYYAENCAECIEGLTLSALLNRALDFVTEFPVHPVRGFLGNIITRKSDNDIILLNRELVDTYNNMCVRFAELDKMHNANYTPIQYVF